jgi:PAS domain S-box-containing protein
LDTSLFSEDLPDENQSKFVAIFNHSTEPMGISCKGIFQLCNPSFLDLFGYSSNEELMGRPVLDVIAPEFHEAVKEYIGKRSRNEPIPHYFSFLGIRKDGSQFDFEISSSNYLFEGEIYSIVIGRDVSENKKIQRELFLSEEKFRIAFLANPSIFGISTQENGQYIEINENFTKILGWEREEVIGHTSKELHIFKDYCKREEMISQLKQNGFVRNFEVEILTKSGEIKTVEFNADSLIFQDKPCLMAQLNDITDRKLAEKTLKMLNNELEVRVKNRTKELEASIQELEAFSYSISHDLKAPLRAINGFCHIVIEENGHCLTENSKKNLAKASEASLYMNQLIDDLLNLYKIKNTILLIEEVDATSIVEEIVSKFQTSEPNRNVEVEIQKDISCWGDRNLIRVMLENLLDNAWKFTRNKLHAKIEFGCFPENGETICFVRDNGCGFNMAFVNKLFGIFQKLHTPSEFPGTGIGLAMIQKIIHLHRGRIWVESELEKGCTFFFMIPDPGT